MEYSQRGNDNSAWLSTVRIMCVLDFDQYPNAKEAMDAERKLD